MAAQTSTPTLNMSDVESKLKAEAEAKGEAKRARARDVRINRASFNPQAPIRLPGKGAVVSSSVHSQPQHGVPGGFDLRLVAIVAPVWPPRKDGERGPEELLVPHLLVLPKDEKLRDAHEPVLIPLSAILDWEPLDEALLERERKAAGTTGVRVAGR